MADAKPRLYEGLFLVNQNAAASDFAGCVDHVKEILARAEAEVVVFKKWDDRRLAYDIEGQKRGVYLLSIFKARGAQIANIERDCNLSEQVLRCLIIRADHLGETEIDVIAKDSAVSIESSLRQPAEGGDEEAAPTDLLDAADEPVGEGSRDRR
jgi:small subunit ribosomal protein S6